MNSIEAYALVTATYRDVRYVLLIETGAGWAMPGGPIEPNETPAWAAWRGLQEETGLWIADVIGLNSVTLDEPRDGAVVVHCDLGEVDALPEVRGRWLPALFLEGRGIPRVRILPAHRGILGAL